MRPKYFGTYTPADDNAAGLANDVAVSGGIYALSANDAGDNLGHLITILGNDITNYSGALFTITGTDPENRTQSESIAGPNGVATVTTTKYFKTVTQVTCDTDTSTDTFDIGWTDDVVTPMYPLNFHQGPPFSVSFGVDITGTINYDVQHRFDNVWSSSTVGQGDAGWFDHASVANKTADADGNYAYPVTALRVLINSLTAGATFTWFIIQGE